MSLYHFLLFSLFLYLSACLSICLSYQQCLCSFPLSWMMKPYPKDSRQRLPSHGGNEAEIFIIAILRGKNNFLYNIDRHTSLGFTAKIGRNAKFRARIGGNAKFFVVKLKIRN